MNENSLSMRKDLLHTGIEICMDLPGESETRSTGAIFKLLDLGRSATKIHQTKNWK